MAKCKNFCNGWPTSCGRLSTVKSDQLEREGKPPLSGSKLDDFQAPILEKYETEGSPYYSTARLWDDGIIDPRKTRDILGLAISSSLNSKESQGKYGIFRM